jgi:TRAP-type C4-dicarboxylate transport system substrate-binding protein
VEASTLRPNRRLAYGIALAALFLSCAVRAASPVVVKMATLVPTGSAWNQSLQEMGQKWEQVSGGRVVLKLYSGGIAGDDADVVRKMRLGTLGAGLLATAGLTDIDRSVLALQIPMLYRDYDEFDAVAEKMTPMLDARLDAKGFVVLAWVDGGWARFFTKTPVRTPDDLKSAKLFAWAGDDKYVELLQGAGFNPVPLPATEISTSLQTGLVDAICTTPQVAAIMQWYGSVKYMTDVNWALLIGAVVVDKDVWEKIPADVRPAILAATRDTARKLRDQSRAEEGASVDAMKSKGLTVVTPSASDIAAWRSLVKSVYPLLRGKYMPADAFEMAVKDAAEYGDRTGPTPETGAH